MSGKFDKIKLIQVKVCLLLNFFREGVRAAKKGVRAVKKGVRVSKVGVWGVTPFMNSFRFQLKMVFQNQSSFIFADSLDDIDNNVFLEEILEEKPSQLVARQNFSHQTKPS